MTWRDKFRPIIARVLSECEGKTEKEVRGALRAACPLGVRAHWPYKVWLDEIRRQRTRAAVREASREEVERRMGGLFDDGSV